MDASIARIIDANANRAREALRVMEEFARFVLEDRPGCEAVKRLRHELADVLSGLPGHDLLTARDTAGDVGTQISTPSEGARSDARDVFVAAAKRLPEALRSMEEYLKTCDGEAARRVEALRYQSYQLEQRLRLRSDRAARFGRSQLYVIITAGLCKGDWLDTVEKTIAGGADCVQLREKGLEDRELLDRARRLAALCRDQQALFVVNDRADIAMLSDADGVHVGQSDITVAEARRIVGPARLVGVSTHTPEQLREAIAAEPDYIAVGPMFASRTKAQDQLPGPALLRRAVRETQIPVVPIGGITLLNMNRLIATGAQRLCVCSGIISTSDPASAARAYRDAIPQTDAEPG
jgi:thiamine-phosphate pyrophosphorylase